MVVSYTVNGDSFRAAKPRQWSQQRPLCVIALAVLAVAVVMLIGFVA